MFRRIVCLLIAFLAAAAVCPLRAEEQSGVNLPLKRVVLFSSGVGFFERYGQVSGDARVEMKFKVEEINDLLKSMVVQDFDGGQVSTVTYASKDPITKTLKSFSIDLTTNPTLAQLLQQVRGEQVVVEAPEEINGLILGVETRKKKIAENEIIEFEVLNLLTETGLRAVSMETVSRIKLANPQLDQELRKALAVLASAHATEKKQVELLFLGKGTRRVRVGYIQQTPVWKTTYRLVLTEGKPWLQGWAIVENTTEEDWADVNLMLVSGRPISFTMDLYQPLYIPRPTVELELYASLRPQVYEQDLARREAEFAEKAKLAAPAPAAPARGFAAGGLLAQRARAPAEEKDAEVMKEEAGVPAGWDKPQGVRSLAEAGNVGNLFRYSIAAPVSLPRQQSAMLPIVNAEVQGEKVSIYNPNVQPKHPLYGLKFTNTTDLHLMQGPITVFDGGTYAGDAKIEGLPPGSQRLISYGLDLETEVAPLSKSAPEQLLSVRLLKGTMIASRKFVRSTEYTIKNSGKEAKTVLVEYPLDADWTLVVPKEPSERTRDLYRFAVTAKPGEPAKLVVEEQRIDRQHLALTNLDDNTIGFFVSAKVVSEKVKAALAELVKRRHEIQQLAVNRQQLEQRLAQIGEDQARIRQNMAQLDRASEVYKNYVKKFSEQETEIEKLREQISALREQENKLRKALDEFLMGLDLE